MEIKLGEYKIKSKIGKVLPLLAEKSFFTFLGLLFLSLILGGFLFYKYDIRLKKEKIEVPLQTLKFKEDTFKEILKEWQEREKKYKEADFKEYPNPFQPPLPATPTLPLPISP